MNHAHLVDNEVEQPTLRTTSWVVSQIINGNENHIIPSDISCTLIIMVHSMVVVMYMMHDGYNKS